MPEWKRRPWGFVIAPAAAVQGAPYLLVLSVNPTIAIRRSLAASPGELPIWGHDGKVLSQRATRKARA